MCPKPQDDPLAPALTITVRGASADAFRVDERSTLRLLQKAIGLHKEAEVRPDTGPTAPASAPAESAADAPRATSDPSTAPGLASPPAEPPLPQDAPGSALWPPQQLPPGLSCLRGIHVTALSIAAVTALFPERPGVIPVHLTMGGVPASEFFAAPRVRVLCPAAARPAFAVALGDQGGLTPAQAALLDALGYHRVALGGKSLLASQAIAIVQHYIDVLEEEWGIDDS